MFIVQLSLLLICNMILLNTFDLLGTCCTSKQALFVFAVSSKCYAKNVDKKLQPLITSVEYKAKHKNKAVRSRKRRCDFLNFC